MPLQLITTQRLYEHAADHLARLIRAGEYEAGTKLPAERDLARQLGVSRTTVREALLALEIRGLVEVRTGSGAFVTPNGGPLPAGTPAQKDTGAGPFELLAARKLFEPPVAALAAIAITEAELAALRETLPLIETRKRDHWEKLEVDRTFHVLIAKATHNAVIVEVVESLWREMFGPIFALLSERTQLTHKQSMTFSDHSAILGCLERRDAAAAHAAMLGHLVNVELTLMGSDDK
jgi:GntR family transcriptional repressor for pyruvate dehydrogenase complex